jgi:hypothetical protein
MKTYMKIVKDHNQDANPYNELNFWKNYSPTSICGKSDCDEQEK